MKLKSWNIREGDALETLRKLPDNHFDASLSDPPYGISFMGKAWDKGVPSAAVYRELLRVLKPGAPILHFGGTRTHHRLMCNIEDAGFELRDCLMWLYGSGFPKNHDISKAIDKKAGAEREVVGKSKHSANRKSAIGYCGGSKNEGERMITAPVTPEAELFDGYGTALKPAFEPVILAMKPLEGTFADNALKWGVAGLNIDACRIGDEGGTKAVNFRGASNSGTFTGKPQNDIAELDKGRWPSNLIVDDEAAQALNYATKAMKDRFFYSPKAQPREKDAGLAGIEATPAHEITGRKQGSKGQSTPFAGVSGERPRKNPHETVKPIALIKYLAALLLPPDRGGGQTSRKILVPYSGSGSEMIGSLLAGWEYAEGIEIRPEFVEIADRRLKHWIESPGSLFDYARRASEGAS